MVVGAGVTTGEGSEFGFDVERFEKVYVTSREQFQDIADQSGSCVGFGDEYRDVLVEPRVIKTGAQSHQPEHRLVDVIEDQNVGIGHASHLRQSDRGANRSPEFFGIDVVHHPVSGRQLVAICVQYGVVHAVDDLAVGRIGEEMDLRTDFREERVGIEIGGPHRLVVIGQQSEIRLPQQAAYAGGCGECPDASGHLLPRSHDDADVFSADTRKRSRPFERSDKRSGAEVLYEVVLVERVAEGHSLLGYVDEDHRHLGHVAQETYPCEIFRPGEELGDDEVRLFQIESFHGTDCILPFVDDPREDDVEKVECPENFLDLHGFAFSVGAVRQPFPQILESGRCDQEQPCFRLSVFLFAIHCLCDYSFSCRTVCCPQASARRIRAIRRPAS